MSVQSDLAIQRAKLPPRGSAGNPHRPRHVRPWVDVREAGRPDSAPITQVRAPFVRKGTRQVVR